MIKAVLLILLFSANTLYAKSWQSPEERVHLLELYSTQSCSSCPPAQDWVSTLKTEDTLWTRFIPVVFHVDYWDYLGWKDPFSKPEFTKRQRLYSKELRSRTYTPMFIVDGEESRRRSKVALRQPGHKVGILKAEKKGEQYQVMFTPSSDHWKKLKLRYALLGNGIKTNVKAGENNGRQLKHDFLALQVGEGSLQKKGSSYSGLIRVNEAMKSTTKPALVFWVTRGDSLKPIQAVGGYL